jgi:hypothetical protein
LCAALAPALLLVIFAQIPLSLSCNLQGKAEPSGVWVVACGLALGPIAFSAIAASGVPPFLTCHLFGKQRLRVPLSKLLRRAAGAASGRVPPVQAGALEGRESRVTRAARSLFGSLDPLQLLLEFWGKERIFRVSSLLINARYSFRDVALTGRSLAALYVLSGVLPERCEIRQTPSWDSEDRVSVEIDGQFRVWPLRLVHDLARFVLKERLMVRRRAPSNPPVTKPT